MRKYKPRTKYAPTGEWEAESSRPDHMVEAIERALSRVRLNREDRDAVNHIGDLTDPTEAYDGIIAIAECYIPPLCWLGHREYKFGCWLDDLEDVQRSAEDAERRGDDYYVDVNDHGNVTIYERTGARTRSRWVAVADFV